ncbi:class II aldolase/adducin family protein [Roseiarcaceae bacterium H3SJ34-1]|uniref:class II aldolase/adducin family protein n=1 Tax=Terripilifer ovatus TaxID=3032367 RepID=UPI003AB99ED9|nr:class II aldolase/adducin family protein [Roseiarcaceae bacterium H3SJ34-1]
MTMTLDEIKHSVAVGSQILSITGLAAGIRSSMGHVSLRDPNNPDRFVVKGRGYPIDAIHRMRAKDMVVCDLDGRLLEGPPGVVQCNEVMIHACVMKARPEVNSVVHVHPPFSVMLTVMGITIRPVVLEGIKLVRKPLPVYPKTALITSVERGRDMVAALGDADAVHLLGHGVTTVGKTMEEAVMNAWQLEHQAQMNYYATTAAGPDHPQIADHLIEEFLQWKPLAEPHFQEAVAKVGKVNTGGSMWSDLVAKAEEAMR